MSKDIIILTPNGRRQKVHCTPDTSFLQVLEDVCRKQGFQASEYDLKHHNHTLDLTTTIRFSNLPNKATLEMVEADKKREESNVTIGLTVNDGDRRTGEFPPMTSLYDIVITLASEELSTLDTPAIVYMRQEVIGLAAMKEKSLRQLGLIGGRAILRLFNKAEEQMQANVSAVYRSRPPPKKEEKQEYNTNKTDNTNAPSTSQQHGNTGQQNERKTSNPVDLIKQEKSQYFTPTKGVTLGRSDPAPMDIDEVETPETKSTKSSFSQENLERRLKIEEEVTFIGAQKAIAFMQPDSVEDITDLSDDFYDLTVDEVRRLYHELQQQRIQIENTPLITTSKKEEMDSESAQQRRNVYKNVVVRVQFPDRIIIQGIFLPTNTIQDITDFIKEHLNSPEKLFHIFTTPLKEALDPKMTLQEAKFVPCVHIHFKWMSEEITMEPCLKKDVYLKTTSSDAASILASKYRAPSRQKVDVIAASSQAAGSSKYRAPSRQKVDVIAASSQAAGSSKSGQMPKWFKK